MGSDCCKLDNESDCKSGCVNPDVAYQIPISDINEGTQTMSKVVTEPVHEIASIKIHGSKFSHKPKRISNIDMIYGKDETIKRNANAPDSLLDQILDAAAISREESDCPISSAVKFPNDSKSKFYRKPEHEDDQSDLISKKPMPTWSHNRYPSDSDFSYRKAPTNFKLEARHFRIEKKGSLTDKYIIEECIGKGSFGEVKKIRDKSTGISRALKVISKEHCQKTDSFADEIEIIKKLVNHFLLLGSSKHCAIL